MDLYALYPADLIVIIGSLSGDVLSKYNIPCCLIFILIRSDKIFILKWYDEEKRYVSAKKADNLN